MFVWRTEQNPCSQFLQLTLSIQSSSLVTCTYLSRHSQHFFSEFSYVSLLQISFLTYSSAFSDLVVLKCWGYLHFRLLCYLTLFSVCFFSFSWILLASSVIKERELLFFQLNVFAIFLAMDRSSKVWRV